MRRLRKHIYRLYFLRRVAAFFQHLQVAGEGGWVAGDVDDALRLHVEDCLKQGRVAAFARRVDDDDVGPDTLGVPPGHDFLRFADSEFGVGDAVALAYREHSPGARSGPRRRGACNSATAAGSAARGVSRESGVTIPDNTVLRGFDMALSLGG